MEEKQMNVNGSKKIGKRNGINALLHVFGHVFFVAMAVMASIILLSSFVMVETKEGTVMQGIPAEEAGTAFEDSRLFNQLFGNSITDIICYGAIRTQMETDGIYDPQKEVDVTAFVDRYEGLKEEYITARYYLEDLIKWNMNTFEYEDVEMTGEEVDAFLKRVRTVTKVDLSESNFTGGTISYLNSDAQSYVSIEDVSGNILEVEGGESLRDSTSATILNNRYLTVDGKKIEDHVFSWYEYYELCQNVQQACEDLYINYEEYQKYNEYYDSQNSNVVYYILRTIGSETEVYSNQKIKGNSFAALQKQIKQDCYKYMIYDPENMVYETNTLVEEDTVRYVLNGYSYAYPENTQILIGVKKDSQVVDAFLQAQTGYNHYSPYFWQYLAAVITFGLFYLIILVVLTIREGNIGRRESGEIIVRLKKEDKICTEIMLLLFVIYAVAVVFVIDLALSGFAIKELVAAKTLSVAVGGMALLASLAFSFFYYSFVRRIKAGTLWKDSLLKKFCDKIRSFILYLYDHAAIVLRVWIPFAGFVLMHLVLCFIVYGAGRTAVIAILLVVLADVLIGVFLYKSAQDRQRILQGIQTINNGDMEHKIDETGLHGDNLVLAEAVNNIGEGIREAVATSMKDERLKADLITNVSHDIKTPLTSIINYVDLIKRENVENPKVKEYIEVLDSKSQRLKQLTDDLVEASKVSSGNIILQWEKINLVELLNQTIGEFSEKFEQKMLTPVFRFEKSSIFIEADSRRIWRVIENLFNNIFKYALTGTRVYIDLRELHGTDEAAQVMLSIMNISANPIKVNTDELTERFIRGDESRTTEGSGLGLSIAKNLTQVQKGKFEITVDGDLFKVILTFPLLEK